MEFAIQSKATAAGTLISRVLPFLSPEVCATESNRVLYNNGCVRAADPIYQRGVIEASTANLASSEGRAILLTPHQACPVSVSHSGLTGVGILFKSEGIRNGRLYDLTRGIHAGNDSPAPPYRSYELPAYWSAAVASTLAIPLHGGFYNPVVGGASGLQQQTATNFRDFTELADAAGALTGRRVIPVVAGDSIRSVLSSARGGVFVAGDITLSIVTYNNAAVRTVTTSNFAPTIVGSLGNVLVGAVAIPAGAIGLAAVYLTAAVATPLFLSDVMVVHEAATAAVDAGVGYGSFVGTPISGLASLTPVCSAGRVTALSLKITNTSSALSTNGFILATATQDATPASTGIVSDATIAAFAATKSFKFADGAYMALAPSIDSAYMPLDSSPQSHCPMGIFYLQGQDATPLTFKLEYNMMFEVVSQDPLFAPHKPLHDPEQLRALAQAQEAGGYLILSENPFHWGAITGALKKGVSGLGKVAGSAMKFAGENPALLGGLAAAGVGIPAALMAARSLTGGSEAGMGAVPFSSNQSQPRPSRPRASGGLLSRFRGSMTSSTKKSATKFHGDGRPTGMPKAVWGEYTKPVK